MCIHVLEVHSRISTRRA